VTFVYAENPTITKHVLQWVTPLQELPWINRWHQHSWLALAEVCTDTQTHRQTAFDRLYYYRSQLSYKLLW